MAGVISGHCLSTVTISIVDCEDNRIFPPVVRCTATPATSALALRSSRVVPVPYRERRGGALLAVPSLATVVP